MSPLKSSILSFALLLARNSWEERHKPLYFTVCNLEGLTQNPMYKLDLTNMSHHLSKESTELSTLKLRRAELLNIHDLGLH